MGDAYGVAHATRTIALFADPEVEAVVICTYDHAELVAESIRAGKHLIVEKPLGFTPERQRHWSARRSDLVAMVGYMKFYDPGYVPASTHSAIGRPKTMHVHDFAGRFDRYARSTRKIAGPTYRPVSRGTQSRGGRIEAALGPDHAGYRDLYLCYSCSAATIWP